MLQPVAFSQEAILSTTRKSQAVVVEAIQAWTGMVQSITPNLPELNMPFTDKLPQPHDLIAGAYDFAEQMLASQRKFAEDVLKAATPLTAGQGEVPARKSGSATK